MISIKLKKEIFYKACEYLLLHPRESSCEIILKCAEVLLLDEKAAKKILKDYQKFYNFNGRNYSDWCLPGEYIGFCDVNSFFKITADRKIIAVLFYAESLK